MPNLDGTSDDHIYTSLGALIGASLNAVIILPLATIWPNVWDASLWVFLGCTVIGLIRDICE